MRSTALAGVLAGAGGADGVASARAAGLLAALLVPVAARDVAVGGVIGSGCTGCSGTGEGAGIVATGCDDETLGAGAGAGVARAGAGAGATGAAAATCSRGASPAKSFHASASTATASRASAI